MYYRLIGLIPFIMITNIPDSWADPNGRFSAQGRIEGKYPTMYLTVGKGGVLAEKTTSAGLVVSKGTVLAKFHCPEIASEIQVLKEEAKQLSLDKSLLIEGAKQEEKDLATAELAYEKAVLKEAQNHFTRLVTLAAKGKFVSDRVIEVARDRATVAEAGVVRVSRHRDLIFSGPRVAELKSLDSQINSVDLQLKSSLDRRELYCQIRAPRHGAILRWFFEPGEYVDSLNPRPVLSFSDLNTIRVRAEVDEKYVGRVQIDQNVEIFLNNEASGHKGRVITVEGEMGLKSIHSGKTTEPFDRDVMEVLIELKESGLPQKAGLRVIVVFDQEE